MRAVFAGRVRFDVRNAAVALASAGFHLLCVNSEAVHEALQAERIKHIATNAALGTLAEISSVALVICQLDAADPPNLDAETHTFIRASAALYDRIVTITCEADLQRLLQHVSVGPAIQLPAFVRERLAAKALRMCAAADEQLASRLEAQQEQSVVLVVGSGGREHAIADKLAESCLVARVLVAPGNAGTATAGGKISNIAIAAEDVPNLVAFARDQQISLVVVGPEAPLVAGLTDALIAAGIPCFGPSAAAAQLEASKAFSKDFMLRHGIRTARYKTLKNFEMCQTYIEACDYPVVVKASGLAAGKGVIIPRNKDEAIQAAREMLVDKTLGESGAEVVIEELIEGEEISVLAFCDGKIAVGMPPAQDHKRVFDHDQGPNTGGMGAYAPAPGITKAAYDEVMAMIQRTLDGLASEGIVYRGVMYAGIMLTKEGPAVLEYNCRFGDPETQALLPLLASDLYEILFNCAHGHLLPQDVRWRHDYACAVVISAPGYPSSYPKGLSISGLENAAAADVDGGGKNDAANPASSNDKRTSKKKSPVKVYHAGTALGEGGRVLTNGGRVLAVTGLGPTIHKAVQTSYNAVRRIHFDGMHYRRDIARRAMNAPLRIAVLGSTRGTSLQPVIDAIEHGQLNARIEVVISNAADAVILERAQRHNIPAQFISAKGKTREQFDAEVTRVLESYRVELVLLIGYMRILSGQFCSHWDGRCLNVHPSLLPDFAGGMDLQVHEAVLAAKRTKSGCTIHFVTEEVDAGPILVQLECDVAKDETPESLKAKVQALEGQAFIEAIRKFQRNELDPLTYKAAGVDIVAGDTLVEHIKPACKLTSRPGCDVDLGGFGALFDLAAAGYNPAETLLVSGTDGVGTKLLIAQQAGKHDTIGIDLVAMCVNDILVAGAEPLFFLDYYACGKLDVNVAAAVVRGIAEGCRQARCGLIGGETAEMPSLYGDSEYDLAGFAVGAVLKSATLPRNIAAGDIVLGVRSSGVHSNGYSLVRKCVERADVRYSDPCPFDPSQTFADALLAPTRIYVQLLLPLIRDGLINGLAHITGGGLLGNLPRILPDHFAAKIDLQAAQWSLPPLFAWLQQTAAIDKWEMLRVFNCGVGMVVVVSRKNAESVMARCAQAGEQLLRLGEIVERQDGDASAEQVLIHGEFFSG